MQRNRSTQRTKNERDVLGLSESVPPEIQSLITALREELAGYGSMLLLLNQQRKLILARRAEALLDNAESIGAHIRTLTSLRAARQQLGREVAEALGCEDLSSFSELMATLPRDCRNLLRALVGEINFILFHCQQRLLQNKLLLGPPSSTPPLEPEKSGLILFGLN